MDVLEVPAAGLSGAGAAVSSCGDDDCRSEASLAIRLPANAEGYKAVSEFGTRMLCPNVATTSVWNYGRPSRVHGTVWLYEATLLSQHNEFLQAASHAQCQDILFSIACTREEVRQTSRHQTGENEHDPKGKSAWYSGSGSMLPCWVPSSRAFVWEELDLGMCDCQLLRTADHCSVPSSHTVSTN